MNKINILVTTASSIVFKGIADVLRSNPDYYIRIIGIDANEIGGKTGLCDSFYVVPMGNAEKKYIEAVLFICEKERIDLILPISDEENLTLAKYSEHFKNKNISLLVNEYEVTKKGFNKVKSLELLKKNKIDTPQWRVPSNVEQIERFIEELGYPEKEVVLKPKFARGSRGFWLISDNFDPKDYLLNKDRIYIKKEWLIQLVNEQRDFPKIFLMEYLPGDSYSIDILAEFGNVLLSFPHKRLGYRWGRLNYARIENEYLLDRMVEDIVRVFNLDNLVNIELSISSEGKPLLIEINPRASSTLALNSLTGIDIINYAIKLKYENKKPVINKDFVPIEYCILDYNMLLK